MFSRFMRHPSVGVLRVRGGEPGEEYFELIGESGSAKRRFEKVVGFGALLLTNAS